MSYDNIITFFNLYVENLNNCYFKTERVLVKGRIEKYILKKII